MLRAERRLSQYDVARRLGCSQSRFSLIENGHEPPNDADLAKLVDLFGVPASKIFPKVAA